MIDIAVREYARLTTAEVVPSLDQHTVTPSAFEFLCDLAARTGSGGAKLVQIENRVSLRLDNFVGVVQTPCGTRLEILPKHVDHTRDAAWSRVLLKKMLLSALKLTTRDVGQASIELLKAPLSEWVMHQFLQQLDRLVKRGLRFDYQRVQEEQRFLRGRLDLGKQLRQPPGRSHFFQIEHDVFVPNRPENRLLRSALARVCESAQSPENWRLAHELAVVVAEVPRSTHIEDDFKCWRTDRLMAQYQPIRPWCELVLGEHMPTALKGLSFGISLLFPMEKLFQEHVAHVLSLALRPAARLDRQVASQHLCQHQNKGFFRLQPDLVMTLNDQKWVLDTKWKVLDSPAGVADDTSRSRYGLSQSDFYQLFAYGNKYLSGKGHLFLVYPLSKTFSAQLLPFHFSDDLVLWVVPFDLDRDLLVGTPGGLPVSWAGAGSLANSAGQDSSPSRAHEPRAVEAQIF